MGTLDFESDWSPTGIQPCPVAANALYDEENIDMTAVNLSPSLQDLANETKLLIPVLPISTTKETRVYVRLLRDLLE